MADKESLKPLPHVGLEFMDDDHEEAIALLDRIVHSLGSVDEQKDPNAEPPGLRRDLRDFIEHSRAHFRREEIAMAQSHFPPLPIHKQEHDQRLEELVGYVDDLDSGVIGLKELKHQFLDEFLPWYHRHCATMDRATARFLEKNPVESDKDCSDCWVQTHRKT